jgi:SAM-dependent methyltransferase
MDGCSPGGEFSGTIGPANRAAFSIGGKHAERKRTVMPEGEAAFPFGKNWEDYVRSSFSDERVDLAKAHLRDFLEVEDLRGKYFLDIGCGSGIHSLAALLLGAERVVSFDVDEYSVKAAEMVRERRGRSFNWEILRGSVLDKDFLSRIEPANIAYSWGVLHHTGAMWPAIENAAGLMRTPDGLFYIALYTTDSSSDYWLEVKKKYNRSSNVGKRVMEYSYIVRRIILPDILVRRNPWKRVREYKKSRGMSFMTDVRDWLGGYPFEHASIEEVLRFGRKSLGLELVNIKNRRSQH